MIWLMEIADESDRMLIENLFERYSKSLFLTSLGMARNGHIAEDAVQETFLRIAKKFYDLDLSDTGKARNLLYVIVRNETKRILQREGRHPVIHIEEIEPLADDKNDIEDFIFVEDSRERIAEALKTLKPRSVEILRLKYINDMSNQEIAQMMGLTETNTNVILHRAIKKIKQSLKDEEVPSK